VSSAFKFQLGEVRSYFERSGDEIGLLHKGLLAEQFVGQHLIHASPFEEPALFYWLRDGDSQKAEVDFLISQGPQFIGVEVKSGKTGSIKSLASFTKEKKLKRALKVSLKPYQRSLRTTEGATIELIEVPFYLVDHIHQIAFSQ
jgi:predicted AAA+ superfamily ATPase